MKEFSKQYCIRECCYSTVTSRGMLLYRYIFSNNIQNAVLGSPVVDYSSAYYMFPSNQMYTPEVRITTKYKVL